MLTTLLKLGIGWAERQQPIRLNISKCTHLRHKASTCTECQNVCPCHSIELNNGPQINWSCNGCGLCISSCPTEVFEYRDLSLVKLYSEVRQRSKDSNDLLFACKQVDEAKHIKGISFACLGGIDDLTIQLAVVNGIQSFNFFAANCEECPLKEGAALFQERLRKWKTAWPAIQWNEIKDDELKSKFLQDVIHTSNLTVMSRREFFKTLSQETKETVLQTFREKKEGSPWKDGELSSQRSTRLQVYNKWVKPLLADEGAIFRKNLTINEQCIGCSICVKICPTQAFEMDTSKNIPVWNLFQCIECGLCQDVCFRKAIQIT